MLTLIDIARRAALKYGMKLLIDETAKSTPEVNGEYYFNGVKRRVGNMGATSTITGRTYYFPIVKAKPTVTFRDANEGTAMSDHLIENKLVETFIMNPNWWVDVAVADQDDYGVASLMSESAGLNLTAAFEALGRQFYYGRGKADAKGHPGLIDSIGYTVDATGAAADTGSSVYAVKWGNQGVRWVMGENGKMRVTPVTTRPKTVVNNGVSSELTVFFQEMFCYPGLHVATPKAVGRIKNLTAEANKGLTDLLLGQLMEKADQRFWPDVLFMTNRSVWQLQRSRTATNATGAPAPLPTEYNGIPIVVTDSLSNTEAIG